MINIFLVNDVFTNVETEKNYRILYLNSLADICIVIELDVTKIMLEFHSFKELNEQFDLNKIVIKDTENTIYLKKEEELSQYSRKLLEESWNVIKTMIDICGEPNIYFEKERSQGVHKVINEFNVSKKYIYKYLRKYWQGGKTKLALVSNMDKCGNKGERRTSTKKLGRPNAMAKINPKFEGINITDEDHEKFKLSIKRYQKPGKKRSLSKIYNFMLQDYYSEDIVVNGQIQRCVKPSYEVPTLESFRSWYYKNREVRDELLRKYGEREVRLNKEHVLSSTVEQTFGPGHIYEIDATIPPVYITNRFKRERGIGKPTLYLVIDVFSKLIVGMYIGLEAPSWSGASSALYNCIENKVEFCKKYDINIESCEWPNSSLPRRLLADRGELVSDQSDQIAIHLNIEVENTAAYMGKDKGNVEQAFRLSENKYVSEVFGAINSNFRKRGEKDYRREALLDINDFTRLVLRTIIHHNNKIMEKYPVTQEMLDDNVNLTPSKIWDWGLNNIGGSLNNYPEQFVKLHLMRKGIATVSEKGILFNTCIYQCKEALNEDWFFKAKNTGRWKVEIRYDTRNMNKIYIIDKDYNDFIEAELSLSDINYNKIYAEIIDFTKYKREKRILDKDYQNKNNSRLISGIREDLEAIKKHQIKGRGKQDMIDNIRDNRKEELAQYDTSLNFDECRVESNYKQLERDEYDEDRDYIFDFIK